MNDSSDADAIRRIAAACATTEACVGRIEKRLWEQATRLERMNYEMIGWSVVLWTLMAFLLVVLRLTLPRLASQ